MKTAKRKCSLVLSAGTIFVAVIAGVIYGHCDAKNGPVAVAAREALKKQDFGSVQIWVGKDQEEELRDKFQQCLSVYRQGGKAKKLAEDYFVETAIRLHRAAEGMPFTGVKPARPLPSDIAAAEKALQVGDAKVITDLLTEELVTQTQKWFDNAIKAKEHKDESVEAGREWVDAYVKYVIYVHGLHQKIKAGPKHGVGE